MSPTTAIAVAPAVATGALLLATHRAWLCRRAWVETMAFGLTIALLAPALLALPPVVFRAVANFGEFGAFWSGAAFAAWRFAPDFGQSGVSWAWRACLRPAFHAGLGLAVAHAALVVAPLPPPLHLCFLATAALASRHAARTFRMFFSHLPT